jgi:putative transposase
VWLYFRFPLSLRIVEEMLAARGIAVTHETIRQWGLNLAESLPTVCGCGRLGGATNGIWMRGSSRSPKETLLWRAVDQGAFVLDVLVLSRRDRKSARLLFTHDQVAKRFSPPPRSRHRHGASFRAQSGIRDLGRATGVAMAA